MINTILSVMFPGSGPFNGNTYDVAVWPFFVIGGVAVIVIAAVIIGVIILAVKLLTRIRNRNTKTPQ